MIQHSHEPHAPLLHGEEWANALIHAAGALLGVIGAVIMARAAVGQTLITKFCFQGFVTSAVAVFVASSLSHYWIHQPKMLKRLRAWDQGLIYVMISGTYTPLIWRFAEDPVRILLLVVIWLAAAIGFHSKVFMHYRVNATGTISYLLLGWLPSLGLIGKVPFGLFLWMLAGAIAYVVGVSLLLNDRKRKYLHAAWHCCVLLAATCHYLGVYQYVATAEML